MKDDTPMIDDREALARLETLLFAKMMHYKTTAPVIPDEEGHHQRHHHHLHMARLRSKPVPELPSSAKIQDNIFASTHHRAKAHPKSTHEETKDPEIKLQHAEEQVEQAPPLKKKDSRSVRFSEIRICYHPIVLGDNPSVLLGPPLTIGWSAMHQEITSLPPEDTDKPRKKRSQMSINREQRQDLLLNAGHTLQELEQASRAVLLANRQRMESTKDFKKKKTVWQKFKKVFQKPREPKRVDAMSVKVSPGRI